MADQISEEQVKVAVEHARAEIAGYAEKLEHLAVTEMGRPRTVIRNLIGHARRAATHLRRLGLEVALELRDELDHLEDDPLDQHGQPRPDPGRIIPANNAAFLAAHRSDLAKLEAAAAAAESAAAAPTAEPPPPSG